MSSHAIVPCPFSTQDFLSAQNLAFADEAVDSVFSMMLGLTAKALSEPIEPVVGSNGRTGIVGFSGSMRGSCELRLSAAAACSIASAMLGGDPVEEGDDSIDDAVGELCNMIAGGWKNRIACLSSTCALSPPTVISGCDYKIHVNSASVRQKRNYEFDGNILQLTLHCLEPKAAILR